MPDPTRRGCLEEIALQIPGYAGYMQKEARRDADRAARTHLAATIKKAREAVEAVKKQAAAGGDLSSLAALESSTNGLARLISKVQNADSGYSGFFDAGQIDESVLDRVTELDHSLISEAGAVEAAALAVSGSSDVPAALSGVTEAVGRFEAAFDRRRSMLKGAL
jgi:hypothetical protein